MSVKRVADAIDALKEAMLAANEADAAARLSKLSGLINEQKGPLLARVEALEALFRKHRANPALSTRNVEPPESLTQILRLLTICGTSKKNSHEISAILRRLVEAAYQGPTLLDAPTEGDSEEVLGRGDRAMATTSSTTGRVQDWANEEATAFEASVHDRASFEKERDELLSREDLDASKLTDILAALTKKPRRSLASATKREKALESWWSGKLRTSNEYARRRETLRSL